ncbi:hypothetical protein DAPPUDRAFT_250858 [Daphnia pulex]|uniref:DDE Tnp4 domain-containing protein n=1 Tax=Daphnia pulex TaxID=6669 RepID=E9GZE0_DAPPU|nr:hypothetical protein DAPPUDRAFT_250858 [Daphnia pulex]|eukprot:EFX75176.1 hypothetical protein DAPPUDRAFT_250858 [Daphnia pulex]
MDPIPLLGIISFLQQEEDDEDEDILAILNIIKFEIRFNAALSSNRQIIERVFVRLKGKFRRLKTYDVKNLDYFNDMIVTACCLHNFTLDLPFELDDDREHQNELNDDFDLLDEDVNEELDDRAIEKRNTIAAYYAEVLEESEEEE